MIPFLAPIQVPHKRRSLRLQSDCFVNVQFYNEIPDRYVESLATTSHRPVSGRKVNVISPRPISRNKSRSPHHASQPSSARSNKSSPIPPPLPEAPPVSRNRNKGLETSSAMMELFGDGSSPFGTTSVFDRIRQQRETGGFHRKNVLEKEMQQYTEWETVKHPPAKAPFFSEVEDHNQAYERARKRGNWRSTGSQLHQVAEPGPEIFEDASSGSEQPIESTDASEREALSLEDNWNEAAENVLATPTLSEEEKQRMMESEPGPDLGDDEHCFVRSRSNVLWRAYILDLLLGTRHVCESLQSSSLVIRKARAYAEKVLRQRTFSVAPVWVICTSLVRFLHFLQVCDDLIQSMQSSGISL